MSGVEFAAWTTGVLALLGIIGAIVKLLMVGHRSLSRIEHIESLARELAPNGGGSIKDAVHRIEGKVDDQGSRLGVVEDRLGIPARRRA